MVSRFCYNSFLLLFWLYSVCIYHSCSVVIFLRNLLKVVYGVDCKIEICDKVNSSVYVYARIECSGVCRNPFNFVSAIQIMKQKMFFYAFVIIDGKA